MDNNKNVKNVRRSGLGFIGTLTLIFIVLKLTKLIAWSWLWVLSPIWLSGVLMLLVFGAILFIGRRMK